MFLVSVELAPVRATLEIDFVRFAVFDGEDVGDSWPGCACPWVSHLRSGACLRHSRGGLGWIISRKKHLIPKDPAAFTGRVVVGRQTGQVT